MMNEEDIVSKTRKAMAARIGVPSLYAGFNNWEDEDVVIVIDEEEILLPPKHAYCRGSERIPAVIYPIG